MFTRSQAAKLIDYGAPAVLRIRHQALQHAQHGPRAVLRRYMLDAAEKPRRIVEPCDIGEEFADLDFGMNAGLELAKSLEDRPGQGHGGVGLLGAGPADRGFDGKASR